MNLTKISTFVYILALILLVKVGLQINFFIGLSSAEYLEEAMFVELALRGAERGINSYWEPFGQWSRIADWSSWRGNPSYMYPFRVAALYPNNWMVALFGVSEVVFCLWTALTGFGSVVVLALTLRVLGRPGAGLWSALALALLPAHVIYTGRMNTDMPQLFFVALAGLFSVLLIKSRSKKLSIAYGLLAGASAGLAYLCKLTLGALTALFAAFFSWLGVRSNARHPCFAPMVVLSGFMLVFVAENLFYFALTDKWFLHWHVMHGNSDNLASWKAGSDPYEIGPLIIWVYKSGWKGLLENTLTSLGYSLGGLYNMPLLGWYGWAALLSIPFLFVGQRIDRFSLLYLIGFLLYFLYVEFGCVFPVFGEKLELVYYHKNSRFVIPCYPGLAALLGIALDKLFTLLRRKLSGYAAASLVLVLFGLIHCGSVNETTAHWYTRIKNSMGAIREAAGFIEARIPEGSRVFIEPSLRNYYRTFLKNRPYAFEYIRAELRLPEYCDGWIALGGSHGTGTAPNTHPHWISDELLPYWSESASPPAGWVPQFTAKHSERKKPSLRILRLPDCVQTSSDSSTPDSSQPVESIK